MKLIVLFLCFYYFFGLFGIHKAGQLINIVSRDSDTGNKLFFLCRSSSL